MPKAQDMFRQDRGRTRLSEIEPRQYGNRTVVGKTRVEKFRFGGKRYQQVVDRYPKNDVAAMPGTRLVTSIFKLAARPDTDQTDAVRAQSI